MVKRPFNTRLSEEAIHITKTLASRKGVSATAIIEMAVREMAQKEGIVMATKIPANWDIADPSTWTLSVTVDAHMGYHHTGMVMRELRDIRLSATDLDYGDIEPTAEHAEWWADVLTAKLDADVAIAEASPETLERVADLVDERNDCDDLECEATVCRRIVAAITAARA